MYKMYIVVSMEAIAKMKGVRGKMLTQAGHAIQCADWDSAQRFPEALQEYKNSDHIRKITVRVDTDEELLELATAYRDKCGVGIIKDAGFTVFTEPTLTCVGIGPIHQDDIDNDLSTLKLFT